MRLHVGGFYFAVGHLQSQEGGETGEARKQIALSCFRFQQRHGMAMEQEATANVPSLDRFIMGPAACGAARLASVRARSMCMSRWTCRKTSWGHGRSMAGSCVTGKS